MVRALILCFGLSVVGCASASTEVGQPERLPMTDAAEVESSTEQSVDLMRFEIDGESFGLPAGICNTYENGTFRFALAEGPIGETGRATATIERYDTGFGHDIIVALEGTRDDGTDVNWYARKSIPVHQIDASIFGGSIDGTARFDSVGGADTPGDKAVGSFSIRCSSDAAGRAT